VQRHAHDRGLDDGRGVERLLQLPDLESVEPRRQRHVRGGRVLALERGEQADRLRRVEPAALEQQLPGRERRGQLLAGENPLAQLEESEAAASRTTSPILVPLSWAAGASVRRCWYSERCIRAITSRCTWAVPSNS